ncbi:hypothetical protein BW895_25955, partial [Bacillus cereus]|uniref:Eco57I restriction-modification methylase domain-containing protein n=4 Tax=Bacillaceae TaxID=186817 RepID=UPI0009C7F5EE
MMDKKIEKFIDNAIKFLKRQENMSTSMLTNFFLIYTIVFCSQYINIRNLENKKVNLYSLKDEAKSKLNRFLFDNLDLNDKEIIKYIEWLRQNPPIYTNEDILGSIYMLTLEKNKRKQLGEHYTRRDLIELINKELLSSRVYEKRIIDPACGSGNFLVNILGKALENNSLGERKRVLDHLENRKFLVGIDIQELPCLVTKLRMLMEIVHYNKEVDPMFNYPVFQLDSLLSDEVLLENNSYDLVITNPPYLRYQLIEETKREKLRERYNAAVGRFDLYPLFIERGIDLAKGNGKVIILCSDKFMSSEYGRGIREYVRTNARLTKVTDLNTIYPFKAAVLSAIYQFEKVKDNKPENAVWLKAYINNHGISTKKHGEVIIEEKWRYINSNSEEILNKIILNSNTLLGDITSKISIGLQTTADKVFCKFMSHEFVEKNNFERQLIYPLLRGRNLKKWHYKWNGQDNSKDTYVLYPYVLKEKKTVPINLSDFPNVSDYLYSYKGELEGRPYFKGKRQKKWFEHWTAHSFDFFKEVKILTPDIASECSFSLDTQGCFYNGTAYSIKLEVNYDIDDYKYVLGLLNSKVINFFHKKISTTHLESNKYRFQAPIMKNYPLVMLDKNDSRYIEIV